MGNGDGHQKFFFLLLFVITLGLYWILSPFFSAAFWGVILAILFQSVQRALVARMGKRPNLAALAMLMPTILIVILPVIFVTTTTMQEIGVVYQQTQGAQPNYSRYLSEAMRALPTQVQRLLAKAGLTNIVGIQKKLVDGTAQINRLIATKALSIGQSTFQFMVGLGVMLYMVFFLLCDGTDVGCRVRRALPVGGEYKRLLLSRFATVACAAVKGNIAVALMQDVLDGFIFWLLGVGGVVL